MEDHAEGQPDAASPAVGPSVQARRFCFTIFHRGSDWLIDMLQDLPANIKFIVFQEEKSPYTNRLHFQGYLELKMPTKASTVQNYFPYGRFHIAVCNGTAEENIAYCTKESTRVRGPWSRGESAGGQGRRTDLEAVAQRVKEGASLKEVATSDPAIYIRNFKGLEKLHALFNKPPERGQPEIFYYWGSPGCGKSRYVRHKLAGEKVYFANDHKDGWFDGYDGEETVVFDDFQGQFPLQMMLKILDYGPLRLWVKGASVQLYATIFYFTSNHPPRALVSRSSWATRLARPSRR